MDMDILELAREAGFVLYDMHDVDGQDLGESVEADDFKALERFFNAAYAAGVAAEREKSLRLWMLLDDVDSADDIAKSDDAVYRSLCRQAHQKRWTVLTGDEVDAAMLKARG
jgi:hypothetical protein